MAADDTSEGDIQFHFFKAITTKQRSYFCDFHRVELTDGSFHYKVVLQSHNQPDILADVKLKDNTWRLAEPDDNIPADLEWLLVTAILEQNK